MPELPEVETIRLGLEKYLVGKKITDVEIIDPKLLQGQISHLKGVKIVGVRRFGKGLVINLGNGYSIAAHIKLTGQFIYRGEETKNVQPSKQLVDGVPSKFTRIIFHLDKNANLFFNDVRRFAWVKLVKTSGVDKIPFFKELGPEPFKDLKFDYFKKVLNKSNTLVKPLLMDQKKISGVGNIYANDALNLARIDPRRKASSLKDEEIKKLYEAILEVLKRGLKYGGATEINFVNAVGQPGGYQNHFLTYGREGEKCKNCGGVIKKIFLAGRGTYFCSQCQK
ncbi:DNA-formamidopyrimidine glycosylase [Candidatus Roizmanbacteria bacterium]|nr:DNA-formamidopyrimidine glycosylase [Candidatus Roizmanbacteria bacterium]